MNLMALQRRLMAVEDFESALLFILNKFFWIRFLLSLSLDL